MIVAKIPRELWLKEYAQNAHLSVFGYEYPDYETSLFDYALLVIDEESNTPIIYNLIRHLKADSFYIEYGGSFPDFRGSMKVRKAFSKLLEEMGKSGFRLATLMTMADNVPMQKLALAVGFTVFGVTMGRHGLCLEYRLNYKEKEKTDGSVYTHGNHGGASDLGRNESSSPKEEANANCGGAN